jgi:5-methylcytosine-specific restriction endonuclease McrA
MPVRSPSRCPRCHCLHLQSGPCPVCRRVRYTERRWLYDSPEWAELRDRVLSEEPLCADCRAAPPEDIDHIRSLVAAPHLALARSNVQGLCKPCHGRKTRRET